MNKVATAAQLRFDIEAAATLPDDVKERLRSIARNRISEDGVLIIEAKRFRTQEQNREDAVARLVALIQQAAEPPKPRKKTRPSVTAKAARVGEKKRRGEIKRTRRAVPEDFE